MLNALRVRRVAARPGALAAELGLGHATVLKSLRRLHATGDAVTVIGEGGTMYRAVEYG